MAGSFRRQDEVLSASEQIFVCTFVQLDWNQLLPQSDFQRSHLLSMLRELMEWAALLKLASRPPAKLLIRDGLLRSVVLTDLVFQRIGEKFEALTAKHGHLLVGVAKRSRVLNYLSVALGLNENFAGGAHAAGFGFSTVSGALSPNSFCARARIAINCAILAACSGLAARLFTSCGST